MFKTDSFLGIKILSLDQNVWRDHATMQQDVLLHFWVMFLIEIRLKYEKNYSVVQLQSFFIVYPYGKQCCLSALELFNCLPPLFSCLPYGKLVRLPGKKAKKRNKKFCSKFIMTDRSNYDRPCSEDFVPFLFY